MKKSHIVAAFVFCFLTLLTLYRFVPPPPVYAQKAVSKAVIMSIGTAIPTVCNVGDLFFKSDATAGFNLYGCGSLNVYTVLTPASAPPSGAASGDLSGSYPSPTVAKINTVSLGSTTATAGNVLQAAGGVWVSTVPFGSQILGGCTGVVTNLATIVMYPFQQVSTACLSTSSNQGENWPAATFTNLRVATGVPSNTAGGGVVSLFKNGSVQTLTCTLGITAVCADTTHSFTTVAGDFVTAKVQSAGGTLTTGPTYASGSSACTNGTQVVTFTNGTSGVNPVNATGTITITANVPVGAVTLTTPGSGYTAATPPTTGTIATCTGTATFTGGTVTIDTLSGVNIIFRTTNP